MFNGAFIRRGIGLAGMLFKELASPPALQRQPEPELLMEDKSSVEGFHLAAESLMPVYHFNALAVSRLTPLGGTVFDLGSGSGQFLAYLAEVRPDIRLIGIDLSKAMVGRGRRFLSEAGVEDRVSLNLGDMTDFIGHLPNAVNVVSSVFSLHHLPTREDLLKTLRQMKTVREKTGVAFWIFDLQRPRSPDTPKNFPEILTPDTPAVFKEDTTNSLIAAWSFQEMLGALADVGMEKEACHSCSPLLKLYQTHWMPAVDNLSAGHAHWVEGVRSLETGRQFRRYELCVFV